MDCPWEEIFYFHYINIYESFVKWMGEQIAAGVSAEIKVILEESKVGERWFQHKESGVIWRLIPPDNGFPFTGHFLLKDKDYPYLWFEIKEKDGFQKIEDVERFSGWLDTQVNKGIAQEIPVEDSVLGIVDSERYGERWFRHIQSGDKWALKWPDLPSKPVFVKVTWM